MKKLKFIFSLALIGFVATLDSIAQNTDTNSPACDAAIVADRRVEHGIGAKRRDLEAKNDLEASHGLVVQTRAVALPQLQANGQYKHTDRNDIEAISRRFLSTPDQNWNTGVQLVQSIYMGGRMVAAFKAADATEKQAFANYQTSVATRC